MNEIIHKEGEGFFIFDENGEVIAKLTYKQNGDVLSVDHTVVSDVLRGQGIAGKLLDEIADYALLNDYKIEALCSYVVKKFETGEYDHVKY